MRNLDVLLKHFNEESFSENTFLYAIESDLDLFDENSMSEVVDLSFLTCFVIFNDVVDSSLRFLLVKFCWDLVVWLICAQQ